MLALAIKLRLLEITRAKKLLKLFVWQDVPLLFLHAQAKQAASGVVHVLGAV